MATLLFGLPVAAARDSMILILAQHAMRAAILSAHGRSEVGGVISCAQQQDLCANYHFAC
ncbi:hypothetical protein EAS54_23940 [Bradyrhizobium guangzhouense]|uniref:Uncharacterized protein n=1 Tax=Bradyrhizobium guangzhouense TaxID=1325095 RepID=A0AAE5X084_9BRAD|nr:hypothetical protein XH91_14020 [Bradyrhizobium guangzhouense]RXH13546.1 hypothetical protein EAS54_23940 [Bradyrhizobium guangzhouense]